MGYKKTILSGNQLEIYEYEKALYPTRHKRKSRIITGYKRYNTRRKDNAGRLRSSFRRIVLSNLTGTECPVFLTLTMASIIRLEASYECFSGFIRRLRSEYGKEWRYIAVPEFQKRGAVHFHVLAWGLPSELIDHERDTRTIQRLWTHGTCDVIKTDGHAKIAGYMAKYMYKAMLDTRLLAQKAYVCSRNIMRPLSYNLTEIANNKDLIFGDMSLVHKSEFLTQWLGACVKKVYLLEEGNGI